MDELLIKEKMEPFCFPALRVIDTFEVSPMPGTVPEKASIPFTFFDMTWIVCEPMNVECIFFYTFQHPTSYFLSNHLPAFKSSLSVALQAFYPAAGNFRRTPETENRFELYYKEGDAITFTVAELDGNFDVLSSSQARCSALLQQLVPLLLQSNKSQRLLAVQVTIFPYQGISLGVTLNHAACDGISCMQFIHSWAALCHSEEKVPSVHVVIDRTLIHDPNDLYSAFYNKMVKQQLNNPEGTHKTSPHTHRDPSTMVLASFTLNQKDIQTLKKLVSGKACSSLVVAFAYTWVGHVRAQCTNIEQKTYVKLQADLRTRLQPPLPATYFGNCIWPCFAEANPADLMSNDGFVVAVEAIRKAIDGLTVNPKLFEYNVNLLSSRDEISLLASAGSPKFRVYDVDFGLGKPAKFEIASIARTGAISVADSRKEQGAVEIGVVLSKSQMDCFEKYFISGLDPLSK